MIEQPAARELLPQPAAQFTTARVVTRNFDGGLHKTVRVVSDQIIKSR